MLATIPQKVGTSSRLLINNNNNNKNKNNRDNAYGAVVATEVIDHTDIFINQRIECYLNDTINLRPLTPHISPCYTHKIAIVSWP